MYDVVKDFKRITRQSGLYFEVEKRAYARSRSQLRRFKDRAAMIRRRQMERKAEKKSFF
jgi:hypothetical protein